MNKKKLLLTDSERSEVIQRDTTLWCPTKGEFLDEVGRVVARAQLAKAESYYNEQLSKLKNKIHKTNVYYLREIQKNQEEYDSTYIGEMEAWRRGIKWVGKTFHGDMTLKQIMETDFWKQALALEP